MNMNELASRLGITGGALTGRIRQLEECGIVSEKHLIGEVDDTRYFAHPDRHNADILWFSLNDVVIGSWTSPGDFGDVRGVFTPDWWFPNWNQHGLLKQIDINKRGTFIDGLRISDVTIDTFHPDYRSAIKFRLAVPEDAGHVGGLTIFGKTLGNYRQDIDVRIGYRPIGEETGGDSR